MCEEKRWRPGSIIIDGDVILEGYDVAEIEKMTLHWRHHSVAINGNLIVRSMVKSDD